MNITIPSDFITNITGNVGTLLVDLEPVMALLAGVLLAFFVIERIMDIIDRKREKENAQ
jgi:hypothetical protein